MKYLSKTHKNRFQPAEHSQRHVALLIETSNEYARGLLNGINKYIRMHKPWSIYLGEHSRLETDLSWLKDWEGDGILARIENRQMADFVHRLGVPTVDLSASRLLPDLPCVETHDPSIARMAADHLLERGFKHFGYCGDGRFNWSIQRGSFFVQFIKEAGYRCEYFQTDRHHSTRQQRLEMADWLQSLPKPAGIMACYDITAQKLLDSCRIAKITVPDEIAVIGVDNDELLCNLSSPSLSSIRPNTLQTGYQAAALLDAIMSGQSIEPRIYSIEPLEVITRMSTDVMAVEDKYVSAAVRFIRVHAYEDINVEDILSHMPISRRSLDNRFRKALGRTPHEEIIRVKIKLIRHFLTVTDLTLPLIAEKIGFKHAEYMSVIFKNFTGMSPGSFREKHHQ